MKERFVVIVSWFLCHGAHAMAWTKPCVLMQWHGQSPCVLMQVCAANTVYLKGEYKKIFY